MPPRQDHLEDDARRLFLELLKRGAAIRESAVRARARAEETRDASENLARALRSEQAPGN